MQKRRPLVLVADDDPDILSLVRLRLERSGYDVVSAGDGEQALERARRELRTSRSSTS
jgi:two-component system, OmpR family, alkaline phosphatase synthesis response regulator PhoP